jgi:hypothetical protein
MLKSNVFGQQFSNETKFVSFQYDFSEDTGAVANYVLSDAPGYDMAVRLAYVYVNTAPTSAGAAVLTLETTALTDKFINSEAIATFTVGSAIAAVDCTAGRSDWVKVASTDTIQFAPEVADLTAGKLTFVFEVRKLQIA